MLKTIKYPQYPIKKFGSCLQLTKIAKFWLSKSIFYVKNGPNLSNLFSIFKSNFRSRFFVIDVFWRNLLMDSPVKCAKVYGKRVVILMKVYKTRKLSENQEDWKVLFSMCVNTFFSSLGGIPQLRGQNSAIFSPPSVDSFYTLSVDKNRLFWPPPPLVHVAIECPLTDYSLPLQMKSFGHKK